MLGNIGVGWGTRDQTDMLTILEGNAYDPKSHQMGTIIAVADVRCVDTFTTAVSNITKVDRQLHCGRQLQQRYATL
jgi:hypothetical protein